MKKILLLLVLLSVSILFAQCGGTTDARHVSEDDTTNRDASVIDADVSAVNRTVTEDRVDETGREGPEVVEPEEITDAETVVISPERIERTPESCAELPKEKKAVCERLLEATNVKEEKCEIVSSTRERSLCIADVEEIKQLDCDELEGEDQELCERKGESYEARHLVRYRHELNEECRSFTDQERATCERRINSQFREYMHTEWRAWITEQKELTEEEKTAVEERRRLLRAQLQQTHEEKKTEIRERLTEKKQNVLDNLDEYIAHVERYEEKMKYTVERAENAGHDTTELEFLLQEFHQTVDDAKVYFDNEQYRDSLAAVKEARQLVVEFKQILSEIVNEHKEGNAYVVDEETAFTEEPEEVEDTDGD